MTDKEPSADDRGGGSIAAVSMLHEAIELERIACALLAERAWLELSYPDQDSADLAKLVCRKAADAIRARAIRH
jgi:hypothetical protein